MNTKLNDKKKFTDKLVKIFILFILITSSILVILPVIWIVLSAFKTGSSLFSSTIIPKEFTLIHFKELFTETDFPIWYFNTLKIATANMVISVVITSLTAYAFARFEFKGRKQSLMAILVLQMFPAILAMTAIYIILMKMSLLDTHLGLILIYAVGQIPYNTWLVKGFMGAIPKSLDEAARIDGASNITIFRKIIFPLSKPILVLVALTNFMGPWFDYIFPRLVIRTASKKTLAMGLFEWVRAQSTTHFTRFAAGSILVAVPIAILFIYLQKHLVHGLSQGATKG
ncbi:MAG: sugar ABC transporter permease [Bacillota bacterium]|nr:sugar ABC transporter permease [Bacillota bacterium]